MSLSIKLSKSSLIAAFMLFQMENTGKYRQESGVRIQADKYATDAPYSGAPSSKN